MFILSLFVVSVTNTTDFEGKEEKIYEQMNKEKAIQKNLSKDASTLIGSFVLLSFLRRKAMQKKRQTKLIMTILAVSGRFKSIKQAICSKEEEMDVLLEKMILRLDETFKIAENAKKKQAHTKMQAEILINKTNLLLANTQKCAKLSANMVSLVERLAENAASEN